MAFDRSTIAPEAQQFYAALGARYGSDDTLRQADKTLAGVAKHGADLARHGLSSAQATALSDVREAMLVAGVSREQAAAGKKATNAAHLDAIGGAKTLRFTLRSTLGGAQTTLFNAGDKASVNEIDAVLGRTSSAGDDSELLARQLEALGGLLRHTAVRQALGDDALAAALEAEVTERVAALASTREQKAGPRGTPAETEYLNLLDGLVVVLSRNARKAARALARAKGQPAIAKDFELSELYRTAKRRGPEEPTPPA